MFSPSTVCGEQTGGQAQARYEVFVVFFVGERDA